MADALYTLRWFETAHKERIEEAIENGWTRRPGAEKNTQRLLNERRTLLMAQIDLIGRVCVQKKLPGGDPPWMAKFIASYF